MYTDLDLDSNFSDPQYQDDWGHQSRVSEPDPDRICLNQYTTLTECSQHRPSDIYDTIKKNIPFSPVYTKLWDQDREYQDFDLSAELANYRKQQGYMTDPCRCGVDQHWVGDLSDNVDICRASCCRPGACQAGPNVFPRGSCRSALCPRVSMQCYRGCVGPWHTTCFPRYPDVSDKSQQKEKPSRLLLTHGFPSAEDEGKGGASKGKGSGKIGGKKSGQGKAGKKGGKKGSDTEKVLKVTDYEQEKSGTGPGSGAYGGRQEKSGTGPGSGAYGGRQEKSGIGPGTGPGSGAYGGRQEKSGTGPGTGPGSGAYGGGYYGIPSRGQFPLCPGRGVCRGPKKVCPGPNKPSYTPVCGKTSVIQKTMCPGPIRPSNPNKTVCLGPAKCGGIKSAPVKSCRAGKK